MGMSDSGLTKDFVEYWQKIHEDLKFWYERADEKSTGIITLSGILLGFVTISTFINKSNTGLSSYFLIGFFLSVLGSVFIAIMSLWARVKFKGLQSNEKNPPEIFFAYIAQLYPTHENDIKIQADKYFDNEISKCKSNEIALRALASEITILSYNLKSKYILINRSYCCVFASIVLMGLFALSKFLF